MVKYRYAILYRPPQLGAIPMEYLISCSCEEITSPSGHHAWGWAAYSRRLSDAEVDQYELEYIKEDDS